MDINKSGNVVLPPDLRLINNKSYLFSYITTNNQRYTIFLGQEPNPKGSNLPDGFELYTDMFQESEPLETNIQEE